MNPQVGIDKRAYISFTAAIQPGPAQMLLNHIVALIAQGFGTINILMSTFGGDVMNGFMLYNTLRAFPVNLITHNVSVVNSIGNVVFLAGKERYATETSTFMFHGVGFDIQGQLRLEEKLLAERLDSIRSDQKRIAHVLAAHTKLKPNEIAKLFLQAVTKDAKWAVDANLVNAIQEVSVPPGAPVITITG